MKRCRRTLGPSHPITIWAAALLGDPVAPADAASDGAGLPNMTAVLDGVKSNVAKHGELGFDPPAPPDP
jgi:hypothetical protein